MQVEGVNLQLGRLQNLMTAAAVETFDFSNYIDLKSLRIVEYKQAYHNFHGMGYTASLSPQNSTDPGHSGSLFNDF